MRQLTTKVYGPLPHGRKWRICIRTGGAKPIYHAFETEREAEAAKRKALKLVAGGVLTVGEALEQYKEDMATRDLASSSIKTVAHKITVLLGASLELPVVSITLSDAQRLYTELSKEWAAATHRNALGRTRAFWRWMVKRKLARTNPWAEVEGVGKIKRGKPQLTKDESGKLVKYCFAHLDSDAAALPVGLTFCLAMRNGEVMALTSRNVDDRGRLIRVERNTTKTDNGWRILEVPAVLVPALWAAAQKAAGGKLFDGKTNPKAWLWYHTKRLCRKAGVLEVCPHGLRGTHTTLARAAGQTAHAVMAQLGHGSEAIQDRHYIDHGRLEDATIQEVANRLGFGNNSAENCIQTENPEQSHSN